MPRNDPSETGGLFIGRRPGTAPLRYRTVPKIDGDKRQKRDSRRANVLLLLEVLICLTLWGPQPVAWLWVGSQVDYLTDSVVAGLLVAFGGMLLTLFLTLSGAARIDYAWKILRRAAGYNQTEGMLVRIFAFTAVVAGSAFFFWLFVIEGPGSLGLPGQ